MKKLIFSLFTVLALFSCSQKKDRENKTNVEFNNPDIELTDSTKITKSVDGDESSKIIIQPRVVSATKLKDDGHSGSPPIIDTKMQAKKAFNNGVANYQTKNFEEGIEDFKTVVKINPQHSKAYYNLGFGNYNLNKFSKALTYFEKAIELNPNDTISLLYCGLSNFFLENYYKSIEYYDKAIEINPSYGMAYYNRGTVEGQLGNYKGALSDLNEAIKFLPKKFDAYFNRGIANFYLGKKEEACSDWEKAKELGAPNADVALSHYCK